MNDFRPDETLPKHPLPAYVHVLIRNGASGLSGWLIAKGILPIDQGEAFIGIVVAAAPAIWGLVAAYLNRKKLNHAIIAPAGQATP